MGRAVDQWRESIRRRRESTHRGGWGGGGARGGLPDLQSSPHPPSGHRRFCRGLWVTSTTWLIIRRSWSLLLPKSKHPRRLLLSAALLTLFPCLELTIVAHQPLAKHYSTMVTVAVCLHEAGEPSSTYYCLVEDPNCVSVNSAFLISCTPWIMMRKRLRPVREFLNCVTWEKMLLKLLHWEKTSTKKFDVNLTQKGHDTEKPSCRQILKRLVSREAWICIIVSEAVLSADYSRPFRCLSIEHQKIVLKAIFKVFTQV